MFPLMVALTMDPRYKLKGVTFCMKKYYKNKCINENDDELSKKILETT